MAVNVEPEPVTLAGRTQMLTRVSSREVPEYNNPTGVVYAGMLDS